MLDPDHIEAARCKLAALERHTDEAGQGLIHSIRADLTMLDVLQARPKPPPVAESACECCPVEPEDMEPAVEDADGDLDTLAIVHDLLDDAIDQMTRREFVATAVVATIAEARALARMRLGLYDRNDVPEPGNEPSGIDNYRGVAFGFRIETPRNDEQPA
jgi:hypothetical protein